MTNLLLILKAVIIGIVEGITEFLPISSTGHMILVGSFIDFKGAFATLFEIVIQFGAILAVVVLYRKKIWSSLKNLRPGKFGFRLWLGVVCSLIPSFVAAKLFYKSASAHFMFPVPVACSLVVGGIAMILLERVYQKNSKTTRSEDVTPFQGFVIGLFQCISFLWPGFSRSAATIMGGWVVGMTTAAAAEYTFFLAIPTMLGAAGYSLLDAQIKLTGIDVAALIIGFVVSFLVALVVVKKFLDFLRHKPLKGFGVYRIIVGLLIIVLAAAGLVH